jgi:hypothetical protein
MVAAQLNASEDRYPRQLANRSDSTMRKTDLNIFYQMGTSLGYLFGSNCRTGQDVLDLGIYATGPRPWLIAFLAETEEFARYLKDSRSAAQTLLTKINELLMHDRMLSGKPVTMGECTTLFSAKEELEKCLERESKYLSVFTVTPKGTYDTNILIESPQDDFPDRMATVLPAKFVGDLKQAARCLVFDIPVGCAFHVCRATESLMIAYYEKLAKQPWPFPNRDWSAYIDHLVKQGAPPTITARLREIKDMDRNPYIHPDREVSLEEAQVLYKLCSGVNYYVAEEMTKLTP